MQTPIQFYKTHLDLYKKELSQLNKKLVTLSVLRIIVFALTAIGVYIYFENWLVLSLIIIVGLVLFIRLLSKYTNIKKQYQLKQKLAVINEDEIKIALDNFYFKPDGIQYQDPNHNYALDIDLFGRGSFFQCIDRTATASGKDQLASILKANNINHIIDRQEAIKELSQKPNWRQVYQATASLIHVETNTETVVKLLQQHKRFLPKYIQYIPLIVSVISVIILGLVIAKVVSAKYLGYWLFVGFFVTGKYLKKISNLAAITDKVRDTFRQYALLLDLIESESFSSKLLKQQQQLITSEGKKASQILSDLSKAMDALDNRNNFISAIFGNGYFLTDVKNSFKIEAWINTYNQNVNKWFEVVSFFDAYNSFGNYAFNNPNFIYPKILDTKQSTSVKQLGHPLLKAEKRVDNDFEINNQQFFIITGANMAGKSTFLRTVSLHIVMANIGLPVCAKSSEYSPVKLITSMRTTDSLTDDSSYFFSELTRLKYIVEAIKTDDYFIILDEILKGTNSTDKAIGSRKFVEKLVASNATGIIATHDLSLCEIEKDLDKVKNYYFDAQIVNDELFFDYTFKQGICQNMNASFLLKKMNIV
ncbi:MULTISPECIES: MutS-related protein [Mesoflavibacter]|uniref:MutS-related protein n=1 Tax=Mesoflavibacter TaxID=444051 RepID=UPI000D113E45|nr:MULTISPECIES: DNA mismatch repair protein MutS [Mesoflavibacter]QIJ88692.1 MutS-related protein, family 1 [Mesoflavibacter sp. HG96]QIJ91420.1 MutS-related protein, family 1 [Mesoflavibacter sp. HG37]